MRLAVIPARGGSERIARKNIRPFAGRPIIAYSIEAARESGVFERIVVSTDDEEIAALARSEGAEIPFTRPAELADGHTPTNAVVRHALEWFAERGEAYAQACCIYATAPFLRAEFLRAGLAQLERSGKSFVFSVTSYAFPVERAIRLADDGTVVPKNPEKMAARSQDLGEWYHDAGQFYWGTAEAFLNEVDLFSAEALPIVLPRHLVQDIDTAEDWRRAELMFKALAEEAPR